MYTELSAGVFLEGHYRVPGVRWELRAANLNRNRGETALQSTKNVPLILDGGEVHKVVYTNHQRMELKNRCADVYEGGLSASREARRVLEVEGFDDDYVVLVSIQLSCPIVASHGDCPDQIGLVRCKVIIPEFWVPES